MYARGMKGKADRLFSQLIRSRGACERCGSTQNLQTAHIVSRRYSATRCDPMNAFCSCARCHLELTGDPYAHVLWANLYLGEDGYTAMRQKALDGRRPDWAAVVDELTVKLREASH
jgi:hypothetical protein